MLPDIDSLWDYPNPAASEARFREILPQATGEYRLQLLTQIARAQTLLRKYDDAHHTLDEVQSHLKDDPLTRVRYLLERGRCHNDTAKTADAKKHFIDAWDLARAHRIDGLAVDAAHMIAIVEPPDAALEWNLRAVEYAKSSQDPKARRWLASLQNNIGWTYYTMGDYAKALPIFEDALRLREEQGNVTNIRVARYAIAKAIRALGQLDKALALQRQLHAEWEQAGEPDGYVIEEIAECLLAQGHTAESRPHFARAHEVLSKDPWFPPNESARLERLKQLGETP